MNSMICIQINKHDQQTFSGVQSRLSLLLCLTGSDRILMNRDGSGLFRFLYKLLELSDFVKSENLNMV